LPVRQIPLCQFSRTNCACAAAQNGLCRVHPFHAVERGAVFPEPLEDELEGFYKLKGERYRLILQSVPGEAGPRFRLIFAERRKLVYEMFSQILGLE